MCEDRSVRARIAFLEGKTVQLVKNRSKNSSSSRKSLQKFSSRFRLRRDYKKYLIFFAISLRGTGKRVFFFFKICRFFFPKCKLFLNLKRKKKRRNFWLVVLIKKKIRDFSEITLYRAQPWVVTLQFYLITWIPIIRTRKHIALSECFPFFRQKFSMSFRNCVFSISHEIPNGPDCGHCIRNNFRGSFPAKMYLTIFRVDIGKTVNIILFCIFFFFETLRVTVFFP